MSAPTVIPRTQGKPMKIHEYQAKSILRRYGVTVSDGVAAKTPEEAVAGAKTLDSKLYVVKSQIHAGGRGKGRFEGLGPDAKGGVISQGRLLRIRFVSAVYLPSTELEVAVRNNALDSPWQKAEGLDVTSLRPANSLAIQAEERGQTVADIDIAPNPFTPNDDQVNDEAHISFSLLSVAAPRTVTVQIYSLGGDSVRRLEQQSVGGAHVVDWDGRDDGGDLVAPGLYLCQITATADTDAARKKHTRVIAVVY